MDAPGRAEARREHGDGAGEALSHGAVRRIAVLRANALGDIVFALPALAALRTRFPAARITLLGAPLHRELLHGRDGPVDEVVVVPPAPGVRGDAAPAPPAELDAFRRPMRERRFDLAVQIHGGGRYSNPFLLGLGARLTIGLRSPDAPPLDRTVPYVYYQPEILRYLEVVALVGARPVDLQPRLAVREADVAASLAVVPSDPRPLAVLHPGAGDPRRRWPPGRFARVGDALADAGARVLVSGVGHEAELAGAVVAQMARPATSVAGRLSMPALVGLLSRAAVVVSNDTGPLHMAAAVGAHTVGIYWCGNLINAGPITRERHRPAISWVIHCPRCGVDCTMDDFPAPTAGTACRHGDPFVLGASIGEVREAALELLAAAVDLRGRPGDRRRRLSPV